MEMAGPEAEAFVDECDVEERGAADSDGATDALDESLRELLAEAREEAKAAAAAAAEKREEADAAQAVAEEKAGRADALMEEAREVAADEKWRRMYVKLVAWSEERGHCNPRRNWKAKIDAREKELGNWSGKQRLEERQGTLNPLKKAALEKIGFAFDTRQASWENFHGRLRAFLKENGKLPKNLKDIRKSEIYCSCFYFRQLPRQMLGLMKCKRRPADRQAIPNERFTQERVDILTDAGLNWMLTADMVNRMKEEKGLIFPMPADSSPSKPVDEGEEDMKRGDIPTLKHHHWLQMFEALVEFKKRHGHTYVRPFNSTPELYEWVCEQREKMRQLELYAAKDRFFRDYQAEMLAGIEFSYSEADVEWMDNYERLVAYRLLFGVVAVTDKFCTFEILEQWLDDNKRLHLGLPLLKGDELINHDARRGGGVNGVTIPEQVRLKLLSDIGVFDVAMGKEDDEIRKSHFFFFSPETVAKYSIAQKQRQEKKRKERTIIGLLQEEEDSDESVRGDLINFTSGADENMNSEVNPDAAMDNANKKTADRTSTNADAAKNNDSAAAASSSRGAPDGVLFDPKKFPAIAASVDPQLMTAKLAPNSDIKPLAAAHHTVTNKDKPGKAAVSAAKAAGSAPLVNRGDVSEKSSVATSDIFQIDGHNFNAKVESRKHALAKVASAKSAVPPCDVYEINGHNVNARAEKKFFLQHGVIVSASLSERYELPKSDYGRRFFNDGRPSRCCRISGCFKMSGQRAKHYLCTRHFDMIAGFAASCEALSKRSQNEAKNGSRAASQHARGGQVDPDSFSCSYCDEVFHNYDEAVAHEKNCGIVEEATRIPSKFSSLPPWPKLSISKELRGEAKVLAEHYQHNVWKLILDYRQKSSNQLTKKHDNKYVSAALGERKRMNLAEDDIILPAVKFPSKGDELECLRLFRRCCGPLAATNAGRKKLIKDGLLHYGDGRSIRYCRVAHCQMVHAESTTINAKKCDPDFLCDWHQSMIQRPLSREDGELRHNKRPCQDAFSRSRKATKKYVSNVAAQNFSIPCAVVVAPAGKLGITVESRVYTTGTFIARVEESSVLAGQIFPGDRVVSIDGEDTRLMDVTNVEAILLRKIDSVRQLGLDRKRLQPAQHLPPS